MLSALVALLAAPQLPQLEAVLEQRIGSADGMIEEFFGRTIDLAADEAGNVYVLDERADELRVFSPAGTYVREIGRRGRGPGELSRPSHVEIRDDMVTVLNPGGRTGSFSLAGELVESATLPFGASSAARLGVTRYVGYVSQAISRNVPVPFESVVLLSGDVADTLVTVPSSDVLYRGPSSTSLIRSSLCRLAYVASGSRGELWIASGLDGTLTEWMLDGTTARAARSIRVATDGTPIGEAARAELLAMVPSQLDRSGAEISVPATISSICDLERGDAGSLWVRLQDSGNRERWTVIDPVRLQPTSQLVAPEGVKMSAFSAGRGYGTWTDPAGVTYVGIFRLE
jgi:hypothetical protein